MIETSIVIAIAVLGAYFLLDSLVWSYLEYEKYQDKKFLKPIILCHLCMTSIWGTLVYILLNYVQKKPFCVHEYTIVILMAGFFNTLFYSIIERIGR